MPAIPETLQKTIETDLIYGIMQDNGSRKYLNLKESSEYYNVDYVALRRVAGKWDWKHKRERYRTKVDQKVEEKKSEYDAECIVQSDQKFESTGEKLRQLIELNLDKDIRTMQTDDGWIKPYNLKMYGDALSSAQAVIKNAQGEILERMEINNSTGIDELAKQLEAGRQKARKKT